MLRITALKRYILLKVFPEVVKVKYSSMPYQAPFLKVFEEYFDEFPGAYPAKEISSCKDNMLFLIICALLPSIRIVLIV